MQSRWKGSPDTNGVKGFRGMAGMGRGGIEANDADQPDLVISRAPSPDPKEIEELRKEELDPEYRRFKKRRIRGEPADPDRSPPPPTRQQFVETAYWNPSIVTGKDGSARVTFRAPTALSEYVFTARGVTGLDTLAGQSTAELAVRKDLFLEVRLPSVLIQGDKPRFLAKVHHSGVKGQLEVKLTSYAGGRERVDPKVREISGDGIEEIQFDALEVPAGDVLRLVVSARVGERGDQVVAEVPIRPWGLQDFATASGSSRDDTAAFVALPEGQTYENPEMLIIISPTTEHLLFELAAAGREAYRFDAPFCLVLAAPASGDNNRSSHRAACCDIGPRLCEVSAPRRSSRGAAPGLEGQGPGGGLDRLSE